MSRNVLALIICSLFILGQITISLTDITVRNSFDGSEHNHYIFDRILQVVGGKRSLKQ
jgi:hypothetical protein